LEFTSDSLNPSLKRIKTVLKLNRMHQESTVPRTSIATLFLIAPFFLWGTAMVAMKGVIPQTTPLFMAGVRLLPAGLLVLLVGVWMQRPQPKGWRAWLWILVFTLVDGTLFQGFLAEGLQRTGAGLGSVMIDSQPIAVALMALWFFGERIGFWGWLGLGVGIAGISLLGLPNEWLVAAGSWLSGIVAGKFPLQSSPLSVWLASHDHPLQDAIVALFQNGQWLMLLASLSMAAGTIISRKVSNYADPITATGWHMVLGGIPLFLGSSWYEVNQWSQLGLSDWGAMAYSTVFGSAIAYGLFFYYASSGSLTSLSSLTFLTPVFALLFGNLLLGETLNTIQWLGVGMTLVSIYLINQRNTLATWTKALWAGNQLPHNNSNLTPSLVEVKVGVGDDVATPS
jgi:drug/metabolite transporter (DMT)-like permease